MKQKPLVSSDRDIGVELQVQLSYEIILYKFYILTFWISHNFPFAFDFIYCVFLKFLIVFGQFCVRWLSLYKAKNKKKTDNGLISSRVSEYACLNIILS